MWCWEGVVGEFAIDSATLSQYEENTVSSKKSLHIDIFHSSPYYQALSQTTVKHTALKWSKVLLQPPTLTYFPFDLHPALGLSAW